MNEHFLDDSASFVSCSRERMCGSRFPRANQVVPDRAPVITASWPSEVGGYLVEQHNARIRAMCGSRLSTDGESTSTWSPSVPKSSPATGTVKMPRSLLLLQAAASGTARYARRKERTYPELVEDSGRAKFVVLAGEIGGRFSEETHTRSTPEPLRTRARQSWALRWGVHFGLCRSWGVCIFAAGSSGPPWSGRHHPVGCRSSS